MSNYNQEYELNVSKSNHVTNLLILVSGIFMFIVLSYTAAAISINYLLDYIPYDYDEKIYKNLTLNSDILPKVFKKNSYSYSEDEQYLKNIVTKLKSNTVLKNVEFDVKIIDSKAKANAFAVPTNSIIIFKQLLYEASSENEITFVLAHELGHFKNRDFLRSLGLATLGFVASITLFGDDSQVAKMIFKMTSSVQMYFSRDQETMADEYGLDLVSRYYGHVNGSKDFFKKLQKTEGALSKVLMFESSHPLSKKRIDHMGKYSDNKGYLQEGELTKSRFVNKYAPIKQNELKK